MILKQFLKHVNVKTLAFYPVLTILYVCESGKGGGFVNSEKWGGGLGTYLDYGIWFVNWKSMKDI